MEQITAIATVIIVSLFFVAIFIIGNFLLYKLYERYINKKKESYAIKLLENGYTILTNDRFGIPMLMSKNSVVVNVWYGKTL